MVMMRRIGTEERGSVMLEFILVLPIYLLLLGGTLLLLDITLGKLYLQESNRNLAWIQNDRFDASRKINKELYRRATLYFTNRNSFEGTAGKDNAMWYFGDKYSKYAKKEEGNPDFWGHRINKFHSNVGKIKVSNGNKWCSIYSGNMELCMKHVSGIYIGSLAISSIQHKGTGNTDPLYKKSYSLTRAPETEENGETLLVRRIGEDNRDNIWTANDLVWHLDELFLYWPASDDAIGTIRALTGI